MCVAVLCVHCLVLRGCIAGEGATLDIGDAAIHLAFKQAEGDLKVALDVVEGIFAPTSDTKTPPKNLQIRSLLVSQGR